MGFTWVISPHEVVLWAPTKKKLVTAFLYSLDGSFNVKFFCCCFSSDLHLIPPPPVSELSAFEERWRSLRRFLDVSDKLFELLKFLWSMMGPAVSPEDDDAVPGASGSDVANQECAVFVSHTLPSPPREGGHRTSNCFRPSRNNAGKIVVVATSALPAKRLGQAHFLSQIL